MNDVARDLDRRAEATRIAELALEVDRAASGALFAEALQREFDHDSSDTADTPDEGE